MSFEVRSIEVFDRNFKRLSKKYHSLHKDLGRLVDSIRKRPEQGTPIGHGCYKIRLAITSKAKGKSGRTPPERFGDGAWGTRDHVCGGQGRCGLPADDVRQVGAGEHLQGRIDDVAEHDPLSGVCLGRVGVTVFSATKKLNVDLNAKGATVAVTEGLMDRLGALSDVEVRLG